MHRAPIPPRRPDALPRALRLSMSSARFLPCGGGFDAAKLDNLRVEHLRADLFATADGAVDGEPVILLLLPLLERYGEDMHGVSDAEHAPYDRAARTVHGTLPDELIRVTELDQPQHMRGMQRSALPFVIDGQVVVQGTRPELVVRR